MKESRRALSESARFLYALRRSTVLLSRLSPGRRLILATIAAHIWSTLVSSQEFVTLMRDSEKSSIGRNLDVFEPSAIVNDCWSQDRSLREVLQRERPTHPSLRAHFHCRIVDILAEVTALSPTQKVPCSLSGQTGHASDLIRSQGCMSGLEGKNST